MSWAALFLFSQLRRDKRGDIAVIAGFATASLVGMSALVVDGGNVINAQRMLQASSDAAALAAAQDIGSATANPITTARQYSAVAGNKNARAGLTATMASGYPMLKCFTSNGMSAVMCSGSPSANGIVVKQQATVSTYLGAVLGIGSINISATAAAGARGGKSQPVDVMIVLDTTQSMDSSDSSCAGATTQCALAGVRSLLSGFWPTVDDVALMVFPGLTNTSQAQYNSIAPTALTLPSRLTQAQLCTR